MYSQKRGDRPTLALGGWWSLRMRTLLGCPLQARLTCSLPQSGSGDYISPMAADSLRECRKYVVPLSARPLGKSAGLAASTAKGTESTSPASGGRAGDGTELGLAEWAWSCLLCLCHPPSSISSPPQAPREKPIPINHQGPLVKQEPSPLQRGPRRAGTPSFISW